MNTIEPVAAASSTAYAPSRRAGPLAQRAAVGWLLGLALVGCASTSPTPDWQMNAHGAVQRATQAYLAGHTRAELPEWSRARSEVGRTGRVDLLARVELTRCAAQVASLDPAPCERFESLRADAPKPERAYADYLAGSPGADVSMLPEVHRPIARSGDATALAAIKDPLSRLVAAGVLFKTGAASPAVASIALDTASAQGWRRPLLAWLAVEARRAETGGDTAAASALRRRMALVEQSIEAR